MSMISSRLFPIVLGFAAATVAASCSSEAPTGQDSDAETQSEDEDDESSDSDDDSSDEGDETAATGDTGDESGDTTTGTDSTDSDDEGSGDDSGTNDGPPDPEFPEVETYSLTLLESGDQADVYHPAASTVPEGRTFPVVGLLQGANVDKSHYETVGRLVASFGFIVVIPNHESTGLAGTGLFMEAFIINDMLSTMLAEHERMEAPVHGLVDGTRMGLLGHSYGGVSGMYALQGVCMVPFCSGSYSPPQPLLAVAFYGTNLRSPLSPQVPATANQGVAVMLLQGTHDGQALPADADATYAAVSHPPKAYVSISGANHYGICDENNPAGAQPDSAAPTLSQALATDRVGRWSAYWMLAQLVGDPRAEATIEAAGADDPYVTVWSEL